MKQKEFSNKTVFISGASRGIGKAIGLKLAEKGANIIIAAKTVEPHPKLPGTIYTAAAEMKNAGGDALAVVMDIRDESMVENAVLEAVKKFGGIDILINNASAINLTPSEFLPMKRYDLMHQVNVRGTYMLTKHCLPFLKKSDNPHVLNLSPPLNLSPKWFGNHVGYTMSKYGMSMCVLGHAEEFKSYGVAVNALWPKTTIDTAAIRNMPGGDTLSKQSRKPDIIADAAYYILSKDSKKCTGNFFIDENVLFDEGIDTFDHYAVDPSQELLLDFFL